MNTNQYSNFNYCFFLSFMVSLFCSFNLSAQSWQKNYLIGANETAVGGYIQETNNQEYLFTGSSGAQFDFPDIFLIRLDVDGNKKWEKIFPTNVPFSHLKKQRNSIAIEDIDNNIYLAYNQIESGQTERRIVLKKLDENGNLLWEQIYAQQFEEVVREIVLANNGDVVLSGFSVDASGKEDIMAKRISSNGDEAWTKFYPVPDSRIGSSIVKTMDGNFVIGGLIVDEQRVVMLKIGNDGNEIWSKDYPQDSYERALQTIEDNDGNLIVIGYFQQLGVFFFDGYVLKTNPDGNQLWFKNVWGSVLTSARVDANNNITVLNSESVDGVLSTEHFSAVGDYLGKVDLNLDLGILYHTQNTSDGGHITAGLVNFNGAGFMNAYVIKVGAPLTKNTLSGKIFNDDDEDCLLTSGEKGVYRWYIKATNTNNDTWFGSADMDGNYSIELPDGQYEITVVSPTEYWDLCQDSYDIIFDTNNNTETLDIPIQGIIECPFLEVHIGNNCNLRICEENRYTISYCNYGTVTAENAQIKVTIDEYQSYVSSTIPFSSQDGKTLAFDIGNVEFGECGSFYLFLELDCNTDIWGYTHCVEAFSTPDTICVDTSGWNGAEIELIGECANGEIKFSAKNIGNAEITSALDFIVIEDEVIYMQGNVNNILPNSEVLLATVPANGQTYRIQSDQESTYPGNSAPTLFIEGCISDNSQTVSTGFVNLFPPNDGDYFVDISCAENNYPYDPNDKLAVPYGYGDEHFINANQQIEYTIRFQNTGTAPANTVVVRDSLPLTLDPATLRPGASSHPYEFTMEGQGVAIFTFENINLPDSTTNFEDSQGFIKFDIQQQRDLPIGTVIENNAAIHFDLAAPVITNTWFHTIGENFVFVNSIDSEYKSLRINAFPNPFSNQTNIVLGGIQLENATLELFDAVGRKVRTQVFEQNKIEIKRETLSPGIYFFSIHSNGKFVGNGKILVQ